MNKRKCIKISNCWRTSRARASRANVWHLIHAHNIASHHNAIHIKVTAFNKLLILIYNINKKMHSNKLFYHFYIQTF